MLYYTILYCILNIVSRVYNIILYYTILYCILQYCIVCVQYCIVNIVLCCKYCIALYNIVLCCKYCIALFNIVLCCKYCIVLYFTILYRVCTILYCVINIVLYLQYCIILHPLLPKLVLNVYEVKQVDDDDEVRERRHWPRCSCGLSMIMENNHPKWESQVVTQVITGLHPQSPSHFARQPAARI
jgi:hypothetical protein